MVMATAVRRLLTLSVAATSVVILSACDSVTRSNTAPLPTVVLGDTAASSAKSSPQPMHTVSANASANTANTAANTSTDTLGGVTASGIIVPHTQVQVVAALAERVKAVDVSVGDVVKAGQVLIRLDDSSLSAQAAQARASLAAAQANYDALVAGPTTEKLRQAQAAVMSATANYSRTLSASRPADVAAARAAYTAASDAYQKVKAGPPPEDIASAEAGLRSAEAALKQAQGAYDDADRRDPAGIGASPAALALEQATNTYTAAKAAYDKAAKPADPAQLSAAQEQVESARAALARASAPATAFDIAQARAQLDQAQAQLDELKAGASAQQLDAAKAQIAAAQAQVQAITTQMTKLDLQAPITGTVGKLNIHALEWVSPGQTVAVLADLSNLQVETTDLSERDISKVAVGQAVTVLVKALGQRMPGHVREIAPLADTIGGDVVYKTTIDLDARPAGLRAGMSVEVQVGNG